MVAIAKRLASAHKISLQQREHFKATHDALTGLINQVTLEQRIDHEIAIGARYQKSFALLMLELENFRDSGTISKPLVNKFLIDFAKRLQNCVRATDTVAKYEDNVFVILLPDVNNIRNIVKVIQSISIDFISPFVVDNEQFVVSPNLGVSLYPNDGESRQQLIEQAQIAMCQARTDEIRNYRFYSTDIDTDVARQIAVEEKIRAAIDSHEYEIHYQPLHQLETGFTKYVESVIHWNESELSSIGQNQINRMIEFMEVDKLFADITLNEICQQISIWEAGNTQTRIPVLFNVSDSQFADLTLVKRFEKILENQNISSESIALLINEKAIMQDIEFATQQVRAFKQAGFKIIIDNFSCGLSYIGKFSDGLVDMIRIDSQMVDEMDNCMDWLSVVGGIVRIASELHIDAIISGINNAYQYKTLQNISGNYWQGDYTYLMASSESNHIA